MSRATIWVTVGILLVTLTGCRQTSGWRCHGNNATQAKPMFVPPPPPTAIQTVPVQPIPLGGFPVVPPPPSPGARIDPLAPPLITKSPPPVETPWQPAERADPAPPIVQPRVQLYAPEVLEKPADAKSDPLKQPNANVPTNFTAVQKGVRAGTRPSLDELDWLRDNAAASVIHIRLPGEDDTADRKQIESRGMRYIAFEVSPQTVTKQQIDAFIALVRDHARLGMFVYDRDGSLDGPMWYAYFRRGDFDSADAALLRAYPLGLQTERAGQHRDMWQAVQSVVSGQ